MGRPAHVRDRPGGVLSTPATYTVEPSPVGELLLTSSGTALTGLYFTPHRRGPSVGHDWRLAHAGDDAVLDEARRQLAAYFAGRLTRFDLPLDPSGTPFQLRVWVALQEIPYGTTRSYGELARHLGHPSASRAVGLAGGRNPVSIVVPCHRVIGADGRLTGYGGGVQRKRQLLDLERLAAGAGPQPLF